MGYAGRTMLDMRSGQDELWRVELHGSGDRLRVEVAAYGPGSPNEREAA